MIASKRVFTCLLVLSTFLFAGTAYSQSALVVALGDSNTAGFGVGRANAFPARLEAMLRMIGYDVQVANAGRNGDTLAGMLARLDSYVPQGTRIVIVQGGYNDVQMGRSSAAIAASLEGILSRLAARQITAVLCGFYNQGWDAFGQALAGKYGAVFVDGSACYDSRYRGSDGLHMTAAGHQVVAARLLPVMQALLLPSRPWQGAMRPHAARSAADNTRADVINSARKRVGIRGGHAPWRAAAPHQGPYQQEVSS